VTAQRAPVFVEPDDTARVVGSLPVDTQVRAAGPDTAEWVRVRSLDPVLSGWVRRADIGVAITTDQESSLRAARSA